MVSNGFNHVPDVFRHALLKLNIVIKCTGNDIRLMRERDGRNHRDMCVLFRWACQDNFWSGNVLSPAKLRDKWTQLEINRNKQQAGVTASKPKLDLTNTDWIYGVDL